MSEKAEVRKFCRYMTEVDSLTEVLQFIVSYDDKLKDVSFEASPFWRIDPLTNEQTLKYSVSVSGDEL